MADGVILATILIPAFAALVSFVFFEEGTKGLSKEPYVTKKGVRHTAKKSRSQHIV